MGGSHITATQNAGWAHMALTVWYLWLSKQGIKLTQKVHLSLVQK
jgi:hypothetical protein